jgi:pimeloyl-ACP methyl ester carboxylesterase
MDMDISTTAGAEGAQVTVHTEGSGPGLVVLHGAGISVRHYRKLAYRLAPHFTVHLYNRRGRSDSAALTGAETLQTDIDDLAAVLAHTGSRNLFGHSGGGFVAMRAGLTLPLDRIAAYDAGIALTGLGFPRGFIDPFDRAVADGDLVEAFVQMGQIHPDTASAKMPHALQALGVRAFLHTPPGKEMVEHLATLSPEVRRILDNEVPATAYAGIDAEVLLTYGSRSSKYFGDTCHALAEALPHARALEIPRASHNTANIAPERFTTPLIDFFAHGLGD